VDQRKTLPLAEINSSFQIFVKDYIILPFALDYFFNIKLVKKYVKKKKPVKEKKKELETILGSYFR
jgi:hypothetical protein